MATIADRLMGKIVPTHQAGLESEGALGNMVALRNTRLEVELAFSETLNEHNALERELDDTIALSRIQGRLVQLSAHIDSVNVEGLTRREAQRLHHEAQDIHEEIGMNDILVLPGVEAFGSQIQAKAYTEAGLKSSDSALSKVWTWILDSLKAMKDTVLTWWDKFFGSVEKLVSYAEKVKAAAANYKDDRDNKKVSIKGIKLYAGGTTKPTKDTLANGFEKVCNTMDWLEKHQSNSEKATDSIQDAMELADPDETKLVAAIAKLDGAKDYIEGAGVPTESDSLLGGKYIEVKTEKAPETPAPTEGTGGAGNESEGDPKEFAATDARKDTYKALGKVAYRVKGKDAKGGDKTFDMDRLAKGDVEEIADQAKSLGERILNMRKSRQELRKYVDGVTSAAKGIKSTAEGLDVSEKGCRLELVEMSKTAVSIVGELTTGGISGWTQYLTSTAVEVLKVAEDSI